MRLQVRKVWLLPLLLLLAVVYFASGFFVVQPHQRGVVRWFGHVPIGCRNLAPGLHYALPRPFCRVHRPKTTKVRRVYIGVPPERDEAVLFGDAIAATLATDMLTGDVNILKARLVVQYQLHDPAQYLFGTEEPDRLVKNVTGAVLIETLAGLPVDQALTAAKARLQLQTLARSQQLLDRYGCGVQLVAVNLEAIEPPKMVISAFQDVVSAKKDGERAADRASTEANRVVSRARGRAAEVLASAAGYGQIRVSRARGEASRFLSLLAEHRKNPEVFRKRTLLQTLEKVLPNVRSYVLDEKPGDPPTHIKIVDTDTDRSQERLPHSPADQIRNGGSP